MFQSFNHDTFSYEKLVMQYFEHFNNHDWAKMASMYSEISELRNNRCMLYLTKELKRKVDIVQHGNQWLLNPGFELSFVCIQTNSPLPD